MTTRKGYLAAALVAAALLLPACPKGKDKKGPAGKGKQAASKTPESKGKPKGPTTAKPAAPKTSNLPAWDSASVLAWAPSSADAVIAVRDLGALYKVFGALQDTVAALPQGKQLLDQVKQGVSRAPIPIPFTAADLGQLGLDQKGTFALVLRRRRGFALLSLSDAAAFKAAAGKLGAWSPKSVEGVPFEVLTPTKRGRPLACHFAGKRAICSPRIKDAAALIKQTQRPDPVAKRLDKGQLALVDRSTGFAWVRQRQLDIFATATVTADGVAVQADLSSIAVAQASRMLGPIMGRSPADSTILGLAKGSTSRAFVRLPMGIVAQAFGGKGRLGGRPGPMDAFMDDVQNLTGDVLAIERPGSQLAIIVGTKDQAKAKALVAKLGKLAKAQLAKTKRSKDVQIKLAKKTIAGEPGLRLTVRAVKPVPLAFDWGFVAGKLGLMIGSLDAVEKLAGQDKADAKAFLSTLSAEDKAVYGKGTLAGLQLAVGDPLAGIAASLDKALPAQVPPQARVALTLGRFLFDQLDHVSFGQAQPTPKRMRLVASLHTLHRDGNADDDAARKLWRKGLEAKYAGDAATFEKTLLTLADNHKKTRYGKLKARQKGALFTTITGIVAAVAIPAFIKYTRRAKAIEARINTRRVAMMARMAMGRGALPKGNTGWTPKKPCCKQPKGICAGDGAWEKGLWKAVRFNPGPRSYFQYRLQVTGKKVSVEARSDFDCDGTYGTYKLEGKIQGKDQLRTGRLEVKNAGE